MAMRVITNEEVEALPFSVSTNLSKLAHKHLRQAKLSGAAWEFCSLLHDRTFGDAGYHRQNGHREYWCQFNLAAWAAELEMDKSNLQRIMAELEACEIIFYQPDPHNPGSGRIGWNIHFEEWQRYDNRRTRGRFAKDTRKQPDIVNLRETSPIATLEQSVDTAPETLQRVPPAPLLAIRNLTMAASSPEHGAARKITMAGCPKEGESARNNYGWLLNLTMAASSDEVPEVVSPTPKKGTEERDTEEITPNGVAPLSADASPVFAAGEHQPVSSSSQTTPQQETLFGSEPKQEPAAKPAASHKKRAKREPTPEERAEAERKAAERAAFEERKAALAKIWLEHPSPRVIKPKYSSGWSNFNKGIKLLAEDGIEPERQGALIDAMLTWSKGTYQPTPTKMHHSLDEVEFTLMQREAQAKKGATHDRRYANHRPEPGTATVESVCSEDTLRAEGWNVLASS